MKISFAGLSKISIMVGLMGMPSFSVATHCSEKLHYQATFSQLNNLTTTSIFFYATLTAKRCFLFPDAAQVLTAAGTYDRFPDTEQWNFSVGLLNFDQLRDLRLSNRGKGRAYYQRALRRWANRAVDNSSAPGDTHTFLGDQIEALEEYLNLVKYVEAGMKGRSPGPFESVRDGVKQFYVAKLDSILGSMNNTIRRGLGFDVDRLTTSEEAYNREAKRRIERGGQDNIQFLDETDVNSVRWPLPADDATAILSILNDMQSALSRAVGERIHRRR